jgi:hypothetical protein
MLPPQRQLAAMLEVKVAKDVVERDQLGETQCPCQQDQQPRPLLPVLDSFQSPISLVEAKEALLGGIPL